MKKLLVLLLALLLSISAAIPAAAESGSDAELERITQSVKTTLDLDTQEYSHFQGDYEEGELVPVWNLYWEGDAGSLSVSALSDGTITSYSLNSAETVSRPSSGVPAFPGRSGTGPEGCRELSGTGTGHWRIRGPGGDQRPGPPGQHDIPILRHHFAQWPALAAQLFRYHPGCR